MYVFPLFLPFSTQVSISLMICALDNPGVIHGMPVSLQLVGRRLEEEKVVKMCDAILQAL